MEEKLMKFIGYRKTKSPVGLCWNAENDILDVNGMPVKISRYRFKTSWDWLIPLVAACDATEIEDDLQKDITCALLNFDKGETFFACVAFIDEHI